MIQKNGQIIFENRIYPAIQYIFIFSQIFQLREKSSFEYTNFKKTIRFSRQSVLVQMKTKRKNHTKPFITNTDEDFPSLHPGKEKLHVNTWDQKLTTSNFQMQSTIGSLEQFPALTADKKEFDRHTAESNSPRNQEDIASMSQNLNPTSQFYEYPMMLDWETFKKYYSLMYNQQMMQTEPINKPEPIKQPEPVLVRQAPSVSRKKQAFTWIEPKSSQKIEQKLQRPQEPVIQQILPLETQPVPGIVPQPALQPIQSPKQVPKTSSPPNKPQKLQPGEEQRPLDKFALQLINRYKKELRKESSDTTVSDIEEPNIDEEEEQMDMLEEIEKNHTILQFRLGNVFQKVIRGKFQRAFRHPYSTNYEYLKAKKYIPPVDKVKQIQWITLGQLRLLNINLDLNITSRGFQNQNQDFLQELYSKRKTKVYYGDASDQQRAEQFIQIIKQAMFKGVDFILLQQGYQSLIRSRLLGLINEMASYQFGKYFYPDNIENFQYNRTTLILSKHPVRFGQMQFEIVEHQNQKPGKFYFPFQAFCQFEILIDKKVQRIGILNCHLRSNGEKTSKIPPWRMRQRQLDCIHDWGKRQNYDRFFVIGDTNMPSGQKFKSENIEADAKFFDAFDQGFTPIGGTYLYKNERNQVVEQRMDRVLMNKKCSQNTVVQIQYEDVLLKSCEAKKLDKKKMLQKYENQLTYITLSDHKMMDITIYMTKRK